MTRPIRILWILAVVAVLAPGFASDAHAQEWKWEIIPNIWAADIGVDVAVNDGQISSQEFPFPDVVDKLDFAFQGHVEAQRGRHGLMGDIFLAQLADDDKTFPLGPGGVTAVADADLDLNIFELGGVFNPSGDRKQFSLLYGLRVVDTSTDIDAQFLVGPGTVSRRYAADDTLYDGLLGARWAGDFTEHLGYQLRADVSAGGTNLTWGAVAGLFWAFGDTGRYALGAGYRHLDIDFDPDHVAGADVDVDQTLSGFVVGFRFSF
jgi:hypothetical protein